MQKVTENALSCGELCENEKTSQHTPISRILQDNKNIFGGNLDLGGNFEKFRRKFVTDIERINSSVLI